jgi:hypothetical protein
VEDYRPLFHQTALPDEHLAEIGRIVVHFAILEWNLVQLIHLLLATDPGTTRAITSQLSFRAELDLSAALVTEKLGAQAANRFKPVAKLLLDAADERNAVAHSIWGLHLSSPRPVVRQTRFTVSRRKGLTKRQSDLHPEDLHAVADRISVATFELVSFRKASGLPDPAWI